MESFLELISKDDGQQLEEIFCDLNTKKTSGDWDLKTKQLEELFVFASYAGALSCLTVLSKFAGKFLKGDRILVVLSVSTPVHFLAHFKLATYCSVAIILLSQF